MMKGVFCGNDLHILKGDIAACVPGRIPARESVGAIEAVGPGGITFTIDDSALISFARRISAAAVRCRGQMHYGARAVLEFSDAGDKAASALAPKAVPA